MTEQGAALMVLDSVFKQIDAKWPEIQRILDRLLEKAGRPPLKEDFARFNFQLAVIGLNSRQCFDIYPKERSERLLALTFSVLHSQFPDARHSKAVLATVKKYIDTYNHAQTAIASPLEMVTKLYYYTIGLKNVELFVADKVAYGPEPIIIEYLSNALLFFSGKWEAIDGKYELMDN